MQGGPPYPGCSARLAAPTANAASKRGGGADPAGAAPPEARLHRDGESGTSVHLVRLQCAWWLPSHRAAVCLPALQLASDDDGGICWRLQGLAAISPGTRSAACVPMFRCRARPQITVRPPSLSWTVRRRCAVQLTQPPGLLRWVGRCTSARFTQLGRRWQLHTLFDRSADSVGVFLREVCAPVCCRGNSTAPLPFTG